MNLLNVYIVLTNYSEAKKNTSPTQNGREKLTSQKLNAVLVNQQIKEILSYKQSALHWNRTLMEERFMQIFQSALDSYTQISQHTGVQIHPRQVQEKYLQKVVSDFDQFKNISLLGAQGASVRESKTLHELEYLVDGDKSTFKINNYLGGIYYLTADEIVQEKECYTIQESKNTTNSFLPSNSDIKDGLFKLILFANLDVLTLVGKRISFKTRLKLTGKGVSGIVRFPCSDKHLQDFLFQNKGNYRNSHVTILQLLNKEATSNNKLEIEIGGSS